MIKVLISKDEMYNMYVVENKNSKHVADILGCCVATAIKILRINNILIRDSIRKNYGLYNGKFNFGWDLDHIIPLSSVNTESELIALCHFSNIQPLCSHVNRDIKKNKLNFILQ